ncbi:MAG: hypothetical protein Q7T07_10510 [Burkholderiaceae bacterium]|nr:hypothetical protein [Burkholderiaceae bacterium]
MPCWSVTPSRALSRPYDFKVSMPFGQDVLGLGRQQDEKSPPVSNKTPALTLQLLAIDKAQACPLSDKHRAEHEWP